MLCYVVLRDCVTTQNQVTTPNKPGYARICLTHLSFEIQRTMKFRSLLIVLLTAGVVWYSTRSNQSDPNRLVIYCAHDATYAQPVLDEFTRQTGIEIDVRFDEESNKSLGLTNLLIAEKDQPRCDVFWNNQTLGTIRLQNEDVLQPYISSNSKRIPETFRDPEGYWTGFAARLRVYIVNTDVVEPVESTVAARLAATSLSKVAIAKPIFGTTLSHYSVLAAELGMDGLKQWHHDLHERGIREVRGNSMSKDLVVSAVCDVGFTDTDDAFSAIHQGAPVAMVPIRTPNGSTICMPNSVAIIRNCQHPKLAEQFVDFVLSAEVEIQLANGGAKQIPLGPVSKDALPAEIHKLKKWASEGAELQAASRLNEEVLNWLRAEMMGQ